MNRQRFGYLVSPATLDNTLRKPGSGQQPLGSNQGPRLNSPLPLGFGRKASLIIPMQISKSKNIFVPHN